MRLSGPFVTGLTTFFAVLAASGQCSRQAPPQLRAILQVTVPSPLLGSRNLTVTTWLSYSHRGRLCKSSGERAGFVPVALWLASGSGHPGQKGAPRSNTVSLKEGSS